MRDLAADSGLVQTGNFAIDEWSVLPFTIADIAGDDNEGDLELNGPGYREGFPTGGSETAGYPHVLHG